MKLFNTSSSGKQDPKSLNKAWKFQVQKTGTDNTIMKIHGLITQCDRKVNMLAS